MRGQHKGENGKVLIVGGSDSYVGCLALAGMAALRTGVDLVYIAAPEKVAWALNTISPDLITIKLPGEKLERKHIENLTPYIERSDAILVGTGMGTDKKTSELISELVKMKKPKVIDADALKVIEPSSVKNAVLTPHTGEFKILFGVDGDKESILPNARPDRVILLKGPVDYISDGLNVYENKTGNAGMTVGGTGDVLAGIVAGLLAQGHSLLEAAQVGAQISGLAGDKAFEKFGYGLLASDIIPEIPTVMRELKIWQ